VSIKSHVEGSGEHWRDLRENKDASQSERLHYRLPDQ